MVRRFVEVQAHSLANKTPTEPENDLTANVATNINKCQASHIYK